jgi:hypothetical protein
MNGAFLVGFALATALQGDAVDVGPDILVSLAGVDAPIVEPHLSINPNNAKQLLAAAMVAQGGGTYGVIAIASNDGGGTWQLQRFESTQAGDPWTAFLPDGTALVAFLEPERHCRDAFNRRRADVSRIHPRGGEQPLL